MEMNLDRFNLTELSSTDKNEVIRLYDMHQHFQEGRAWDYKWRMFYLEKSHQKWRDSAEKILCDHVRVRTFGSRFRIDKTYHFYDIWSNIHFGFIGAAIGYKAKSLSRGADIASILATFKFEGNDDKITMKLGYKYFKEGYITKKPLSPQKLINDIEKLKFDNTRTRAQYVNMAYEKGTTKEDFRGPCSVPIAIQSNRKLYSASERVNGKTSGKLKGEKYTLPFYIKLNSHKDD